jgi:integrase
MPVEFLSDEQAGAYGRYAGAPTRAELDRFFFLDNQARGLIERKRRPHNKLGFALQVTTVHYLGTFLADPTDVPTEVVDYLSAQLGIVDPSCLKAYREREMTRLEHAREIRDVYEFTDFSTAEAELAAWVDAQAWTSGDGPKALFDGSVLWLGEHKVLLPGLSTLARLVARVRDEAIGRLWDEAAPSTWNRNRAAVGSWLTWCASKKRWAAPLLPADAERRKENTDATKALPKAAIERAIARRDVPVREKTLWRMLYETAARASEILALNVEDLDLEARQARIRSKGGDHEWVHWGTGTAHLLPRLLRLADGTSRTSGPVFLAQRRPVPARRPGQRDVCPHTGRARLGYDRARILLKAHTGWELHQLRHSAATHLGEKNVPLQLIMAKTRHRSPRTAMRYINPGPAAVAEVTELLDPPRRQH